MSFGWFSAYSQQTSAPFLHDQLHCILLSHCPPLIIFNLLFYFSRNILEILRLTSFLFPLCFVNSGALLQASGLLFIWVITMTPAYRRHPFNPHWASRITATEYSLIPVSLQYWTKYCPITLRRWLYSWTLRNSCLLWDGSMISKGKLTIPTTPAPSLEEYIHI